MNIFDTINEQTIMDDWKIKLIDDLRSSKDLKFIGFGQRQLITWAQDKNNCAPEYKIVRQFAIDHLGCRVLRPNEYVCEIISLFEYDPARISCFLHWEYDAFVLDVSWATK